MQANESTSEFSKNKRKITHLLACSQVSWPLDALDLAFCHLSFLSMTEVKITQNSISFLHIRSKFFMKSLS
jgi:hypothetical protein